MSCKVFRQIFIETSKGIINIEYIDFIRREGDQLYVWLSGKDTAALILEGKEAETFMSLLQAFP